MSDRAGMSVGGQTGYPSAYRGKIRPYEIFELCLCCVLWPAVAAASATLLYWLWIDNPDSPSLSAKLASTIFVLVFLAAAVCTVDHLSTFALRLFRRWAHSRRPHATSSDDARFV